MPTWEESMTIGIQEIDVQHKTIIGKFNELADVLASDSYTREKTGELLGFLRYYLVWHFKREEEYFEKFQCLAAEANKHAHTQVIEQFDHFFAYWRTHGRDRELIQVVFAELGMWIENHMMHVDTHLRPCVIEITTKATQEIPALARQKAANAAIAG